jgi:hypothetical protein
MVPAILLASVGMAGACLAADPVPSITPAPASVGEGWKLASQSGGITIYSRSRPSSSLKEFKGVGDIEAPTRAVHGVLDDVDSYPSFMPFTVECRIVKREGDSVFTYQRLSPKIVTDRDYTIRLHEKSWSAPGGLAYLNRWQSANDQGPAERKGVLRVKLCEGAWLLEPQGTTKTRATYSIYTDSGGALPAFIANKASEIGIRRIFAAVRKQVKDPKYNVE